MKTIKTLFAILFLSTFFIACEAESADDQVGIDLNEEIQKMSEDGDVDEVQPGNLN